MCVCVCVCVAKPVAVELRCHATALIDVFMAYYSPGQPHLGFYTGFYLRSPYLIIISAICHCHPFKNELVLVLNTAWRKQPIVDYVSNHNRMCGNSVSENSE